MINDVIEHYVFGALAFHVPCKQTGFKEESVKDRVVKTIGYSVIFLWSQPDVMEFSFFEFK